MTTSLILQVVKPPIGPDHLVAILRSNSGGGFDDRLNRNRVLDDCERSEMSLDTIPPHVLDAAIVADEAIDAANDAAEQRIRSNADLAIATHASHLLGRCDWPAKANSWHWP